METIFIEILKILESYQIEGEKCVKYPTPLARDLTKKVEEHYKNISKESDDTKIKWRHVPGTSSYIMEFE